MRMEKRLRKLILVVLLLWVIVGVSGQEYYKNGTFCTTELVTQAPITDNPCQNGGVCDGSTSTCICPDGWANNATLGIVDCRVKKCLQGEGPSETLNKCACDSGWSGYQCEYCDSNDACINANLQEIGSNGNLTQLTICDNSYYTRKRKTFKCTIDDPFIIQVIGSQIAIQCQNISFPGDGTSYENGICSFQSWSNTSSNLPSGYEVHVLQCTLNQCSGKLSATDEDYVAYYCETTRCTCSGLSAACNVDIQSYTNSMLGWGQIECNRKTNICQMGQKALGPITIEMKCTGAECVAEPIPDPPAPDRALRTKGIIAGVLVAAGFIVIVIIAIIVLIYSIVHEKQLKGEWERMKNLGVGAQIECKNLKYTITSRNWYLKGSTKTILDNVNFTLKPGRLIAIMGESGSGKTTLLDILANRNKSGKISGDVLINDRSLRKWVGYKRLSAYVSQDDRLMGTLTVKETLNFAADLKLPTCVTQKEKKERIDEVLRKLSIEHVAERRIGTESKRGISGGEKRRVSIAMELVHNPQVLFLDEPTSGLDAASALEVCQYLKEMSNSGRTVVLSIHQPRSNIFNLFDDIILMSQGCLAYFGPAKDAAKYFEMTTDKKCPEQYNPADYLLDVVFDARKRKDKLIMKSKEEMDAIVTDLSPKEVTIVDESFIEEQELDDIPKAEEKSTESEEEDKNSLERGFEELANKELAEVEDKSQPAQIQELYPYATSFASQLRTLSRRSFFNFYRNIFLFPAHIIGAILAGIIIGAIFSGKLSVTLQDTQSKVGIFFIEMFVLAFICLSSIEIFMTERQVYVRELANNYYYTTPYFLSKVMFDILPLRILPPILMVVISYFWIGLNGGVRQFFWNLFLMILFNIGSGAFCILIGSIAPGVGTANILAILLNIFFVLFAGFPANRQSLSRGVSWITYISFWAYPLEGVIVNEFVGTKVTYQPEGLATTFEIPGETVLNILGFDRTRFYVDVVVTAVYGFALLVISGVLLKIFVKEKR